MEKNKIYLTIDLGTTSVKVCAVNEKFRFIAAQGMEYSLLAEGKKVEALPETYWSVVKEGIKAVAGEIDREMIAGITITSQGETLIPVDEKGKPLYNAIVWLDNRAEEQAVKIQKIISNEEFFKKTGVPECTGLCPISKILWWKEETPELYRQTKFFLLLEDYIIYCLTGKFVTEKSLLSTTGYFNLDTDEVWEELLEKLNIDKEKIPKAYDCGVAVSKITSEIAKELEIPEQVMIVTGAMDQVCAAMGAGNVEEGIITETTGTAMCIGETIAKTNINIDYALPVYRHYRKDLQLLIPVCMTAGMTLKWFKDVFCKEEEILAEARGVSVYDILSKMAKESKVLSNGLVLLPYLTGSIQPYNAPNLRGSFLNVGMNHTKADFVRSIMEGVGYMLKENLLLLEEVTKYKIKKVISLGGGAKSDIWCEIKADINEVVIEVKETEEMTSLGAAFLCALGMKQYASVEEMYSAYEENSRFYQPKKEETEQYKKGFEEYKKYLDYFVKIQCK